jgi:hypothetical protein
MDGSDAALRQELVRLARQMVFGVVAERGRVCGKPTCHCARGERHPSAQLSYRGPEGKTVGHHVPQGLVEPVREGVAAWHRFQAVARELAERNRVQLWSRARRKGQIR